MTDIDTAWNLSFKAASVRNAIEALEEAMHDLTSEPALACLRVARDNAYESLGIIDREITALRTAHDAVATAHAKAIGTICSDPDGDGCCDICGVSLDPCDRCGHVGYHHDKCELAEARS